MIILRKNCYLGASATIVGPVEIGEGAMIGAGAVVVRDIPPMTLAVGVPAKVVKKLRCNVHKMRSKEDRIPIK